MKCLSFLAILVCFLNVSVTWSLSNKDEIPSQIMLFQNQVTSESSMAEKTCYDKYTTRQTNLMAEIKNKTNICVNGADLQFQINEKVKQMPSYSEFYSNLNSVKYFTCMNRIADNIEEILIEVYYMAQKFSKRNKTSSIIDIFEGAKYKSSSAVYDLNVCLQSIDQSTATVLTTSPKPTENLPKDSEEFSKVLDKIKVEYAALKGCVLDDLDFSLCWEQVDFSREDRNSRESLFGSSSDRFVIISEFDKAENTCIRQFIKLLINEAFQFDLEGCLRHGNTAVIQYEENEEKDIQFVRNLIRFHNSFDACRVISKDIFTYGCVKDLLRGKHALKIQKEVATRSEENYKKISKIVKDLYIEHLPCIADIVPEYQFDSLNMYYDEKYDLENCLMLGYKLPAIPHNEHEILTTLKTFQDSIKSCTLHPDSPGLRKCLYNYVSVFYDFRENFENYKLADEYDENHHTCYRTILEADGGFDDTMREELEKCIFI